LNNGLMACRRHGHPILLEMMDSVGSYCEMLSEVRTSPANMLNPMLSPFLDGDTLQAM